jgi:hypothetical protein
MAWADLVKRRRLRTTDPLPSQTEHAVRSGGLGGHLAKVDHEASVRLQFLWSPRRQHGGSSPQHPQDRLFGLTRRHVRIDDAAARLTGKLPREQAGMPLSSMF